MMNLLSLNLLQKDALISQFKDPGLAVKQTSCVGGTHFLSQHRNKQCFKTWGFM